MTIDLRSDAGPLYNCPTMTIAQAAQIQIRRAHIVDVPEMSRIINEAAELGLMLPKALVKLYENIREFHVAVVPGEEGQPEMVVGVCGLSIVWANLAEVASLAVAPLWRGRGVGGRLVRACVEEARELGIRKMMTLTYERAFFERHGFHVVDRQELPLKVWTECVRCPKNQACDEIAMIRILEDVPELELPRAPVPSSERYMVPVTLTKSIRGAGE